MVGRVRAVTHSKAPNSEIEMPVDV